MMQSAIRITTKVLPGNKVEVQIPSGCEGQEVEVFVVLPPRKAIGRQNILKFLEELRDRHPQRSAEDINRDLAIERDSWDS
ncbi:hypothetical protein [Lyngbya sp. CCY1209]|jgi:hypothetical protein|uniref:hypothetical protein n=1 Tax=Lyngbya sp. CCY1209 TaxID=2886103 RepID=UPI002D216B98|nr:hypothetical protein [Lyngbya sp. CCY1209]MEB3885926.1 hypothetical protein [Lyngbya sp. CCY1209]